MKNKKSIMAFSALQILFFHLWVNVFAGNEIELFLRTTAFVGVDIFFFMSGLSLSSRKVESYLEFELSRFKAVYLKFIIFAIVAAIYSKWTFSRFIRVVTTVDLFKKGGGAFLWFLPAIMIVYLFYPVFQNYDEAIKEKVSPRWGNFISAAIVVAVWFIVGLLVCNLTDYTAIFIFYNRIPIFVLGYYLGKSELFLKWFGKNAEKPWIYKLIKGIILTAMGVVLVYAFAFRAKLQMPFTDFFYIMVIPLSIGIALLVSFIPEVKVIKKIGSVTLEMYALQMIFGFKLANKLYKISGSAILTNIMFFLVIIVAAVIVGTLLTWFIDFIFKKMSLFCGNVKKSID